MSKYRIPSNNSKYYIPKEDYLTAVHYALRYPLWVAMIQDARDTSTAIRYDKDKVQTSPSADMIPNAAIRSTELIDKVNLIDNIINLCTDDMQYFLRLGVCYGLTFNQLKGQGMPCERDKYYLMRKMFYYNLSQKI